MRVIAGSRRSLPLKTLPGLTTRPTSDKIKETLFNILMPLINGCRFLDVFAGSGGIGIEALSRGASFACFIEKDPRAAAVIRDNLAFTKFTAESKLITSDAVRLLSSVNKEAPYDVIFMDPPYVLYDDRDAVRSLFCGKGWVHRDSVIVMEAGIRTDLSWIEFIAENQNMEKTAVTERTAFEIYREKYYKTNKHIFIRPQEKRNEL